MRNTVRQQAILRLVRDRAISTQAELVDALREEGHDVVQTTISRDVHDLGLTKVRAPSGRLVYAAPGTDDADRIRAIGVAMRRYATRVEQAGPLVVVGHITRRRLVLHQTAHCGLQRRGTRGCVGCFLRAASHAKTAAGCDCERADQNRKHRCPAEPHGHHPWA